MSKPSIEIIGGNTIGEKASMLIDHAHIVAEARLEMPRTVVVAEECLKPLREVVSPNCDDTAPIPASMGRIVTYLSNTYKNNRALAVRSSAEGDAIGTGTYESVFTENTQTAILRGVARVLASFHTQKAQVFRRQTGAGDDFGVIVQPLVGQYLDADRRFFAPAISGTGYSRTDDDFFGIVKIVAGLGGGVDRGGTEPINHGRLAKAEKIAKTYFGLSTEKISFYDYIRAVGQTSFETPLSTDFRDLNKDGLNQINGLAIDEAEDGIFTPKMQPIFFGDEIEPAERHAQISECGNILIEAMRKFEPEQLLEALQNMEERARYPLYIEWALIIEAGRMRPYILQIAPRELQPRSELDIEIAQDPLVVAKPVKGHGIVDCKKMIYCSSKEDIEALIEFNKNPENEGYILVFPARLTAASNRGTLRYEHFSNASTIIETNSRNTHGAGSTMTDHIEGVIEKTGKIYGEFNHFNDLAKFIRLKELLLSGEEFSASDHPESGSVRVINGNFRVISDQLKRQLFIDIVE